MTQQSQFVPWSHFEGMPLPISDTRTAPARVDEVRVQGERTVGLFPDIPGGSQSPYVFDLFGENRNLLDTLFRAAGPHDTAALPIDPITTELVLGPATFQSEWTTLFFPRAFVFDAGDSSQLARTEKVQWARWRTQHLADVNTHLAPGAPFSFVDQGLVWETGEIETHGLATSLTDVEKSRAMRSLDWIAKKAALPMHQIERVLQYRVAELILDSTAGVAFAPGHILSKGAGTEWDQPGVDLLDDFDPATQAVANTTGFDKMNQTAVFTQASWNAATRNEAFIKHNAGITAISRVDVNFTAMKMREYLGVGSVEIINPTGPNGQPLFDDVAWIVCQGPVSGSWDTSYGAERYGARLGVNDGFVLDPWNERLIRTEIHAAMKEYNLKVLNPGAGYRFDNTSKEV